MKIKGGESGVRWRGDRLALATGVMAVAKGKQKIRIAKTAVLLLTFVSIDEKQREAKRSKKSFRDVQMAKKWVNGN